MTNEERRKATEWFRNRAKNCQMPGARRMYEIATEALEEPKMERQVFVTSDGKVHTITTKWLGDFSPYTCKCCGFHVDSKTKYCPECGRKAVPGGGEEKEDDCI